jgi:putative membrane protein insertion efficiency factor
VTVARLAVLALIRLYQRTLSPLAGGACRHVPSCSHYAHEAVERHGAVRGVALAARRLLRCHPLGSSGYDPVP